MILGGYTFLSFSLLSLTSCADLCERSSPLHYRAVAGETFMMPCQNWSSTESHGTSSRNHFTPFKVEEKHSGCYKCHVRSGGWRTLHLQVVNETVGCLTTERNNMTLDIGAGGWISCPGHNCSSSSTEWYKGNTSVPELKKRKRHLSVHEGRLLLHTVIREDSAVFFCDRELSERGVNWTVRRSVTVTALDPHKCPPKILQENKEQEVELGTDYTLICEVDFPEADPPRDVRWFMRSNGRLQNLTMEELQVKKMELGELRVIGKAILRKVTANNLNRTYTCIAHNTSGNVSVSIRLKEKIKEHWSSLVEYALGPLTVVTGLGIVLRVKWLEILLILKSRWTFCKTDVGNKDFDIFLSYLWSASPTEPVSLPSRDVNGEGACPFTLDPLAVEIPSERPELLLPHVLEDQWGYRLCLMERDCLPGGAYTKEVVNAIQRSRMLVCLLSSEYLSDNNAVFVLESGVQALLQNSGTKLLLIWTNMVPVPVCLDPSLPVVVRRALKVLPALKWTSAANTNFWRQLRKALPHQSFSSPP